jgi:hypothetical protein
MAAVSTVKRSVNVRRSTFWLVALNEKHVLPKISHVRCDAALFFATSAHLRRSARVVSQQLYFYFKKHAFHYELTLITLDSRTSEEYNIHIQGYQAPRSKLVDCYQPMVLDRTPREGSEMHDYKSSTYFTVTEVCRQLKSKLSSGSSLSPSEIKSFSRRTLS